MTKDSERLKPFDNLLNICIDMSHHADTLFQFQRRKTKQKHNTICVGQHYTQTPEIRLEPSYKQLEVKTNRRSFLCENRNGHHNTELSM